jgi:magnesium transporter
VGSLAAAGLFDFWGKGKKEKVMIYFTELQNLPAYDVKGEYLGRVVDLAVNPSQDSLRVSSYIIVSPSGEKLAIPHNQMQSVSVRAAQATAQAGQLHADLPDESLLRVKKDIVDQQIIDVNHRKVVRANDVDFDIQPADGHTELRILAVNVGVAAAVRRLLQGMVAKHTSRVISNLFSSKTIPWHFVNLIESDPGRRVKLRISYARLARLHPADIADILEELGRDEQKALLESLDDETAAQVLSEVPTHLQKALLESFSPEKAADIVEEMPPDEAADVLQELPPETSATLLADMEKEEAREVRELLGFEERTAGSLMTTDYIVVGDAATVEGAVEALRNFEGSVESIHQVHLVDSQGILTGAVPLGRILLAESSTPMRILCSDPLIFVDALADQEVVVELFHKYNLLSLPVVDEKHHLLGVVTADDVLELVIKRR